MDNLTTSPYLSPNTSTDSPPPDNISNYTHPLQHHNDSLLLPSEFLIIYFTLQGIVLLLAAAGNSLTIVAIAKYESLHTATNLMLASLAMADLSAAIALPFELWTFAETRAEIWNKLCLVSQILGRTSTLGNCAFTTLVALDRFIFINHPLEYHGWVTWERAKATALLTWIGICSIVLPLFMATQTQREPDGYCFDLNILHTSGKFVFFVLLISTFILTLVLYGKVAMVARRHRRQIEAEQQRYGVTYPVGKERRITSTMGTVLGFYAITTIPTLTLGPVLQRYRSLWGQVFVRCLALFKKGNTFVNPIVYAWRSPEFRQAFRRLLHLKITTAAVGTAGVPNAPNVQVINIAECSRALRQ